MTKIDWKRAACHGADTEIFFAESPETLATALEYCHKCPLEVKEACLEVALTAEPQTGKGTLYGVYGGLTPNQRKELALSPTAQKVGDTPA